VLPSFEQRVACYMQENIKVARRCTARAGFALAGQANPRPFVYACRNVDGERLGAVDTPFAATGRARVCDDLTCSMARRAGALDNEETLLRPYFAMACARTALSRRRAGLGPAAATRCALCRHLDADLGCLAVEGVLKGDFEIVTKVGTARRSALAAAPGELAEDIVEDVRETFEALTMAAATAVLERGMAEPVIGRALLRIFQTVIGFRDRLELGLGFMTARVFVRVEFHGELAIG
jgi:hypothetical protein